jgi:hypothetical protein
MCIDDVVGVEKCVVDAREYEDVIVIKSDGGGSVVEEQRDLEKVEEESVADEHRIQLEMLIP